MYTIEMLPAYLGDSLWVEYGDPARPSRILIDGGLVGTADVIEQKIKDVAAVEGRCRLELLVLTHVDVQAEVRAGLARVTAALNTPIAGGEYLWGIAPFRHMIEARSVDVVMVDIVRVGGVTQWMKVAGMAEAFKEQLHQPDLADLSFEERFALLVERHWTWKEDRRMKRLLSLAKLKINACIEEAPAVAEEILEHFAERSEALG